MVTTITEIDGCLNYRPLIFLNDENTDDLLTPNHPMYGSNIYLSPVINSVYGAQFDHTGFI